MSSRNLEIERRPGWRNAFRLDLRRALFAVGGVALVVALTFFVVVRNRPDILPRNGFGYETRTGSIIVMPLVGDNCRQIAFNNDTGTIAEGEPAPCRDLIRRSDHKPAAESGHIMAVGKGFRK